MSTKVPPDGGWGWMIVIAYAFNSLSTLPILQVFGLVFKDAVFNLTATSATLIININFAFGMILGLINAPLLKTFGYRKIAIVGSLIYSFGIILTAFATSVPVIIITYGMLASFGMGMSMSGFSLAINTYFTTRRGRATGLAVTIVGLGPVCMPQVASFLLSVYGTQGTILLLGAYSLHSLVGAILLQPVKWHMKSAPICLETISKNPDIFSNNEEDTPNHNTEEEMTNGPAGLTMNNHRRQRKLTVSSIDHDIEVGSIYGFDTPLLRQLSTDTRTNVPYDLNYDVEMSIIRNDNNKSSKYPWWNSAKSINLGSSIKIFDEPTPITKKLTFTNDKDVNNSHQDTAEKNSLLEKEMNNSIKEDCNNDNCKSESVIYRILQRIATMYDLDLLRDPIYVNIMLGMSIAIFAEANFSLLTPFILADMSMTTAKIATAMSVIAATDLVSRALAPFLGEWLHQPARIMYLISLCLLIISRTSLLFVDHFIPVLLVAISLGIAKGIRTVYMVLVIPNYVSIQKLPSASAIQMVFNGLILTSAGPILGVIRDRTGSYKPCIILINTVTAITVTMWLMEIIYVWKRSTRQKPELPEKS